MGIRGGIAFKGLGGHTTGAMYKDLIFHLIPYIKPYKIRAFGAILLSFALAAIGGFQVSLIRPIFDQGLNPETPDSEIFLLAGQLMMLGIINFPCRFYHFYWIRFIVEKATCKVREELMEKIQRLPVGFFTQSKQGQVVSCMVNDTYYYSQGFKAFVDTMREPLKAIVFLTMAFLADWQLTVIILLTAPLLILIFHASGKRVKNNQVQVQDNHGELTHNIVEGLQAQKIVKAFNLQDFAVSRFRKIQSLFFRFQMKTTVTEELAHPFVEFVGTLAFSGVIIFAHHRIQTGATSVGEFVSFVAALALFMDPVRKFSQANIKLSQAAAAYDRMRDLLDQAEEADEGEVELARWKESIEIDNVTFRYGGENKSVIKNLGLTIKKGQRVALVGLSGSGKSTFVNLLLGLYPIEKGEIRIDGIPLSHIKLKSLRRLFGLVGQDVFLFHDTILRNLTIGQTVSSDQIKQSLEVSHAQEFVTKLPDGINTVVGDRGIRLSGGQQQRLTIARAFLQGPEILLFDEATSALDNESEKVVQDALDKIAHNKTIITVAHRLSTIQDYDQIFVLHEGTLVEQGTHHELMEKKGEYRKLYELGQKGS